jgi:hypothetical protein
MFCGNIFGKMEMFSFCSKVDFRAEHTSTIIHACQNLKKECLFNEIIPVVKHDALKAYRGRGSRTRHVLEWRWVVTFMPSPS